MLYSRRDMGKLALAAFPTASLLAKLNSNFGGVQVGINVPYSYGNNNLDADDTLNNTVQLGLSAVELRTQPIESFLGSPGPGPYAAPKDAYWTPDQRAEQAAAVDALRKWRLSRTTDQFKSFRKKFEDAGVAIQIMKVDGIDNMDPDVVDYCFVMAKTLGARAISCEIPLSRTKWLGAFADKHKLMVGYHGHAKVEDPEAFALPSSWETAMAYAKYNGINLDLGHFLYANKASPVDFIRKHHDRITHVHVKDRKLDKDGTNLPFGQGDTPIREVLRLMQKEKWQFQATIEFEYRIPADSDRLTEIAKCVAYCKAALT